MGMKIEIKSPRQLWSFSKQSFPLLLTRNKIVRHSGSQQSAAGSSQLPVPVSGTPCRKRHQHHHWRFSVNVWKSGFQTILFWS